jgi:hypothetical protein
MVFCVGAVIANSGFWSYPTTAALIRIALKCQLQQIPILHRRPLTQSTHTPA